MPVSRVLPLMLLALVAPGRGAAADKVDFVSQGGIAFLEKHCLACHGDKVKRADLSLHTYRDDLAVLKARKVFQGALHMVTTGEMPPKSKPRPTPAEIDTFVKAVNGVFERAEKNAKPDPGKVTIRRLNRVEYDNTIRDLVGVDFNPAEDFPSDDVGHGFDNIGDVLTLSPVLMERYLAAAESIVQRAITPNPPAPSQRWMNSRYLEPAIDREGRWRPLDPRGHVLHTPYRITLAGEYVFRVRAYAQKDDPNPVKVAVLNGSTELKRFDVSAPMDKPTTLELKVELPLGDHRFFLKLLDPPGKDKERTVYVEWFNLTGPSDTRPLTHRRLLACDPAKPKAEQTREVLTRFASKAYRRPATKPEVERLVKLVEAAEARGDKWESAMQLGLQAVLVSPKFLFRVELDDRPESDQPKPLDEHQLAARLSYFLWSTMPDDELTALAGKGQLTVNLDAQVRRMLKDPKARELTENFALQWLQLRRLATFAPDPKLFPGFNDPLRAAMLQETTLFFDAVVREDRSILDLIDADFTFVNEALARHYGLADTNGNWLQQKPHAPRGQPIRGPQFQRVQLSGGVRGGLLTQASVLTVTSNPTRTSPVKRGRWVLEQLLGTPPPPPPPDVPELKEEKMLTGSLRQRMEQHRANPACASCHARMDPIGFAFENFDAVGVYRAKDGDFPIDPSGTLPDGRSFKGPAELKKILKDKKDLFSRCLTEKLMIYALGRGLEYYDRRSVDKILAALERDNYRFSTLVIELVKSDPFRLRRGKDETK